MTTGQRPLPGASLGRAMLGGGITTVTPPSKIRAETTPALDALVARLLAADPSQRPVRLPSPMNCERSSSRSRVVSGPESLPPRPRLSRSSSRPRGGSRVERAGPPGWKSRASRRSPTFLETNWIRPTRPTARRSRFRGAAPTATARASTCSTPTPACRAGSRNPVSTTCRRHGRRTEPTLRSSE